MTGLDLNARAKHAEKPTILGSIIVDVPIDSLA